jgi:SAM-dependent methyltransferase
MDKNCSICKSQHLIQLSVNSSHTVLPGIPSGSTFYRCSACKSLSLLPIPSHSQLSDLYDRYFTYDSLKPSDLKTYKAVLSKHSPKIGRRLKMLDIGAGGGHWARAASSLNYDVTINDLNPNVVEKLDDIEAKLEIGFFEDIDFAHKFDLIIAMNVFEHLIDPDLFVQKVYENLSEGGVFILKTPLADSLAERVDGEKWQHFYELGHIVFSSKKALKDLFDRNGFTLVKYVAGGFPPFMSTRIKYVQKRSSTVVESKKIKTTNLKFRIKSLIANSAIPKFLYLKFLQFFPIGDSGYWYFKK